MKDPRVIKGKFEQNGIRPSWSLILERAKRRVKKREEEKKKRKNRRKVWKLFVYGIVVWMAMFLYGTCMEVF